MTNYERIKNMSIEEMAEFIIQIEDGDGDNCLLKKSKAFTYLMKI